jgi:hypothetical protein
MAKPHLCVHRFPAVVVCCGEPTGLPSLPSPNLPNDQPDAWDFNHPQMVVVCAGDVEKTTRAKKR